MINNDWGIKLIRYLNDLSSTIDFKLKQKTHKYILLDNELYKREVKGLLLKCLDKSKVIKVMGEIHKGIYGSHRLSLTMR